MENIIAHILLNSAQNNWLRSTKCAQRNICNALAFSWMWSPHARWLWSRFDETRNYFDPVLASGFWWSAKKTVLWKNSLRCFREMWCLVCYLDGLILLCKNQHTHKEWWYLLSVFQCLSCSAQPKTRRRNGFLILSPDPVRNVYRDALSWSPVWMLRLDKCFLVSNVHSRKAFRSHSYFNGTRLVIG